MTRSDLFKLTWAHVLSHIILLKIFSFFFGKTKKNKKILFFYKKKKDALVINQRFRINLKEKSFLTTVGCIIFFNKSSY